jgi:hypothetical protein
MFFVTIKIIIFETANNNTMILKSKNILIYFISLQRTMLVLAWLHTPSNCNIVSTSFQIENATLPL